MTRRLICPSGLSFFGLTHDDPHTEMQLVQNYKENILEHIFLLMYYGGFSYSDAYKLPIQYRAWFINRINQEFKKSNDKGDGASRAAHHNTPDTRQLQGRARDHVPANLRRFT